LNAITQATQYSTHTKSPTTKPTLNFQSLKPTTIKMKSALVLLTSALSIASARTLITRQAPTTQGLAPYTLFVSTVNNPAGTTLTSDPSGSVFTTFQSPDFLVTATIYNPADNVQCVARDQWGNQVRAFGGPLQDVDSITLVENDGKQVSTLSCTPFVG
jgi:hypothetical protein